MAGSHYTPELLAKFAKRTRDNHNTMYLFGIIMGGILFICMLFHLIRILVRKCLSRKQSKPSVFQLATRKIRNVAVRKAPVSFAPSIGHTAVIFLYFAANIILTLTNLDNKNFPMLPNIASRAGWMAIGNFVLVVLLSLKNTPLAFFSWSYERLNILHRYAGWVTVIQVLVHLSTYCAYFVADGRPTRLLEREEIYGMVAGCSFFFLAFSGIVIRPWWYELFYVTHIFFWIVGIIMLGLHQPELSKNILQVVAACGGVWVLDRLLRIGRLLISSVSNEVTLYPLSDGATRVCLKKPPMGAAAGKHCFLWIPKIRQFETHPFTIASLHPMEFVIAAQDGFTADLHRWAVTHPGITLKASVDGAYGSTPNIANFDKTIMVGGGCGASFVFGMALDALKRIPEDRNEAILLIWIVRNATQLPWYARDVKRLQSDGRVSVKLFVTRSPNLGDSDTDSDENMFTRSAPGSSSNKEVADVDPEKGGILSESEDAGYTATHFGNAPIAYGRPDVGSLIGDAIHEMSSEKHVLVLGCGPSGLMETVRSKTVSCLHGEAPSVELHCEEFGW